MRKILSLLLVVALIGFVSCKLVEPNTDEIEATPTIQEPTTNDLFSVDGWSIYFDGAAPNYIEGYFEFDMPINKSTFESGFELYPIVSNYTLGNRITGFEFNWQNDKRVEFRTTVTYDDDVDYYLEIPSSVRSIYGTGVYGNYSGAICDIYTSQPWMREWNTGSGMIYDLGKPYIRLYEVEPWDGEWDQGNFGNVANTETFRIYGWIEDLDPASVSADAIRFEPSVAFTVSQFDANEYDIIPSAPLALNTDYKIFIDMDYIKDERGNTGYDNNNGDTDNIFWVKFDTYETLAATMKYGGHSWWDNDEELAFWFNTPSIDNDYLDNSTINYNTVVGYDNDGERTEYVIEVQKSTIDKRTYIILKGSFLSGLDEVIFTHELADIDGNTLDGNWNNRLEGDFRDDYSWD